jgi:hypothetical protein
VIFIGDKTNLIWFSSIHPKTYSSVLIELNAFKCNEKLLKAKRYTAKPTSPILNSLKTNKKHLFWPIHSENNPIS